MKASNYHFDNVWLQENGYWLRVNTDRDRKYFWAFTNCVQVYNRLDPNMCGASNLDECVANIEAFVSRHPGLFVNPYPMTAAQTVQCEVAMGKNVRN